MKYSGQGQQLLRAFLGKESVELDELTEVLIHPSSSLAIRTNGVPEFQRQEFLGDAAVGLAVALVLYRCMPQAAEGDLTGIRSLVVRGTNLAAMARWLGLGELLQLGDGEDRDNDSILADSCEVFWGFLVLRCGIEAVCRLMEEILTANGLHELQAPVHPKTALKEYAEQRQITWSFREIGRDGPEHEPRFTCEACVGDRALQATGGSRKDAETEAARRLLTLLGEEHD